MDYSEINNLLNSLEIKDNMQQDIKSNSNLNSSELQRNLTLNNTSKINLELVNPQRQFNNESKLKTADINNKISDYNFIQKKKYDMDFVDFKK